MKRSADPDEGGIKTAARKVGGGLLRLLYGAVALLAAGAVFFVLGAALGFWSPALAAGLLGLFGLMGLLIWRMTRYLCAAVFGLAGAGLASILGSTEGLGLKVAIVAAVLALASLWFALLEILEG